jgi:hypothetical protein
METFKRIMASKPDDTPQNTVAVANWKQTFNDSVQMNRAFFQRQMLTAGLQETNRKEIMIHTEANFQVLYEAALDFISIQQDNAAAKPVTVSAIKETPLPGSDYQDK